MQPTVKLRIAILCLLFGAVVLFSFWIADGPKSADLTKDGTKEDLRISKEIIYLRGSKDSSRITVRKPQAVGLLTATPSEDFENRLQHALRPFINKIKTKEVESAEVVAHYIEGNVEVAAVKFNSLNSDQVMMLHADVAQSLGAEFEGEDLIKARAAAAKTLDLMLDGEHPHNGITVAIHLDGSRNPKFTWVRDASDKVFVIEPDGRIKLRVAAGSLTWLNEKEAEERFGDLIAIE